MLARETSTIIYLFCRHFKCNFDLVLIFNCKNNFRLLQYLIIHVCLPLLVALIIGVIVRISCEWPWLPCTVLYTEALSHSSIINLCIRTINNINVNI